MQDPNADTEWNDILRAKGILPAKEEPTVDEETVVKVRERETSGRKFKVFCTHSVCGRHGARAVRQGRRWS